MLSNHYLIIETSIGERKKERMRAKKRPSTSIVSEIASDTTATALSRIKISRHLPIVDEPCTFRHIDLTSSAVPCSNLTMIE